MNDIFNLPNLFFVLEINSHVHKKGFEGNIHNAAWLDKVRAGKAEAETIMLSIPKQFMIHSCVE